MKVLKQAKDYVSLMLEIVKSFEYLIKVALVAKQKDLIQCNKLFFCQVISTVKFLKDYYEEEEQITNKNFANCLNCAMNSDYK